MSTYTEAHKEYYQRNKERILSLRLERERTWIATPKGKYSIHKRKALRRGIEFLLSFDEWWNIWQESGKWDERSQTGYVMCRTNDTGAYEIGNVRIDTASNNAKENCAIMGKDARNRWKKKSA